MILILSKKTTGVVFSIVYYFVFSTRDIFMPRPIFEGLVKKYWFKKLAIADF